MRLVHRHRAEAALPKMARAPESRVNVARITAVHRGQCPAQPVSIARHQDQMHMVRHKHPGPDRDACRFATGCQQITVEGVIGVAEKHLRATVAPLRDVVRYIGNNEAGETGHAPGSRGTARKSNFVHCHRNLKSNFVHCHRNHETETIIHEEAELRLGDGPAGPLAEPVLAVDESA
ncbi:MAG: hypothetical protein JO213_04540 [Alphaproteobacteria bacterium]|nr:hypothetical protein [Alphaproteobacteria bacterium]